jgi:hypothetical protein
MFVIPSVRCASPPIDNPVHGQNSTSSVVYNHTSLLSVFETITPLAGGIWRYSYEFTNKEPTAIWHFGVWTTFQGGDSATAKTFDQMIPYGTWIAAGVNITGVISPYDARNLDPQITWLSSTWDNPWPNSPNPIPAGAFVSGFAFNATVLDKRPKYYYYEIYGSYIPNGVLTAVGLTQPKATFQYHFRISPYGNIIHLNITAGGWLNGYMDLGPANWNPILGKYYGDRFYMAIDVYPDNKTGYFELLFLVGTISTKTGQVIQTYNGMSYLGPTSVTLVPVTSESEVATMGDAARAVGSQVNPQSWYKFKVDPYADIVHLNTNPTGWLNGYDETWGGPYPVLGFTEGGRFYFGLDGINTPYTLVFVAGQISTKDGYMIRTETGTTYDGPQHITLTPV